MLESKSRRAEAAGPEPGPVASATRDNGNFAVVGIGASAGGLEAFSKLVDGLPPQSGMAFILVQHLDPTHESMMVELLASHTLMNVRQATDGMQVAPDHLYLIPPGTYLSVDRGCLHLSQPKARHGARLPFDFLLHSLAEEYGSRTIAVVLSGTGTDGSLALKAIKEKGGLVVAQEPLESAYDGMPRGAIMTGTVDLVLPVTEIADALVTYCRRMNLPGEPNGAGSDRTKTPDLLPEILELLYSRTEHDFRLYKPGTLRRRIERRMAMSAVELDGMEHYLELLIRDANELETLSRDLLINVTSFFRDGEVFDHLAETVIPELILQQAPEQFLRIWIAGCSTGEEAYSIAMVAREAIAAAKSNVKLQFFASDVDIDALAVAREGFYPDRIATEVSPERLARFFSKEDGGYRVSPELRASIVFTAHDVLADPPFSRIDMISCRNLLIYLQPEAQAKAISAFHFALRAGGILLLGNSESVDNFPGRFETLSKPNRLYRHVGRSRPGELGISFSRGETRFPVISAQSQTHSRQGELAEFCRRLVIDEYSPAAILIDSKQECLFSLGPTDRFLHVAPGNPSFHLLTMARHAIRSKLRSAVQRAVQANKRIVVEGVRIGSGSDPFRIDVRPVQFEGQQLLLVCFIEEPMRLETRERKVALADESRVAELENELETARTELQVAIHDLESSAEEQKAINDQALSVNEEFQSTNEELLTSKEELQSLNEELTALNGQLQETLERQRTTSNDLQNILYSTDVATIFLDPELNIRFFTPATRSIFHILPGDIGRPLADLSSLLTNGGLYEDARSVLQSSEAIEREIESNNGAWYIRSVMPYRTQDGAVEGVVMTFLDITARRHVRQALENAEHQARQANAAKSSFLAAASHDLRQPLQTLNLIQAQLARIVEGEKALSLVSRLDETVGAMADMLNALLDINQIEAGTVRVEKAEFSIGDLLGQIAEEFAYLAQAKGLTLQVVPCGLSVTSDPRLLGQMIRNLLANALKYTNEGKILLGCRRRAGMLGIEIWDTGIGIPDTELKSIFDEYHQLDNAARDRSRGLGLGLSIVQRLGNLLHHHVSVRSRPGNGSVFAIEVPLMEDRIVALPEDRRHSLESAAFEHVSGAGTILLIEDDPGVSELLVHLLNDEGHHTATAPDGVAALELVAQGIVRPDLILADYNLPLGMTGLQTADLICERLQRRIPVIVLTGDISTHTLREIARHDCLQLNKPVKLHELTNAIQTLLSPLSHAPAVPEGSHLAEISASPVAPVVFVVDDNEELRGEMRALLEGDGCMVEDYASCEAFLEAYRPGRGNCLLIDAYLPGMSGMELLAHLSDAGDELPAIMMTGSSDVPMAVRAMKAGALDFIEKPVSGSELISSVARAIEQSRDATRLSNWRVDAAKRIAELTPRQHQIMDMVLAGHPSKNIAADLGISQRTVENHRASIMKRTGSKSLPALARLAVAAVRQ